MKLTYWSDKITDFNISKIQRQNLCNFINDILRNYLKHLKVCEFAFFFFAVFNLNMLSSVAHTSVALLTLRGFFF